MTSVPQFVPYAAGTRFGKLTILSNEMVGKRRWYLCQCDCGKQKRIVSSSFKKVDFTKSCGCLISQAAQAKHKELRTSVVVGSVFGRLTVLRAPCKLNGKQCYWVICRCSCGNEHGVSFSNLVLGNVRSCGCSKLRKIDEDGSLTCSACKQKKPTSEFFVKRENVCGFRSECKICHMERWRRQFRANPLYKEKMRASNSRWSRENPEKNCVRATRRRIRLAGCKGSYTAEEWLSLCDKYDNCCLCCGKSKPLTVDHVIPVALKGKNDISNLQPLCQSCNSSKGSRTIDYRK